MICWLGSWGSVCSHVHRVDLLFVANRLSPPQFCSREITAHIQPLCSPSVSSQPCGSFTALFPVSLWRTEAHCPLILTTQHFTVICCHCLLHWVYKRSAHCHQKQLSHRYIIRFVKMNNTSRKKLLCYKTTHLSSV